MGEGLLDLPAADQCVAEVVVGLDVVRLDFQCLPIMDDRLLDPSAVGQSQAEIVVRAGIAGGLANRILPDG